MENAMVMKNETCQLILVPALITLGVTILRLIGELSDWSALLFNPDPGGGGAIIGIAWLVPVFGIYFSYRLNQQGSRPDKPLKSIGLVLLALLLMIGLGFVNLAIFELGSVPGLIVFSIACLIPLPIVRMAWPKLFNILLQYGLAARIPVAIIMFFAIFGDWGTHYDAPPDNLSAMHWFSEWLITGLLPQLTFWIAYTLILGGLAALITVLFLKPRLDSNFDTN
jgi:hypothetical protein